MQRMDARIRQVLAEAARKHDLPPDLVAAMAMVESSGNPWASRTEPAYRWLWDVRRNQPYRVSHKGAAAKTPPQGFPAPPGISQLTEWIAQQTSWGLLQLMGANARAMGFSGPLPRLCDADTGADHGCRFLADLARRFRDRHGWRGVVQAFNTGSPTSVNKYPDKVASAAAALGVPYIFGD